MYFEYVVILFVYIIYVFATKKHATKIDAYMSNFQPVNSDLKPFREKKDNRLFKCRACEITSPDHQSI